MKQLMQLTFIAHNKLYTSCGSVNELAGTVVSVLMSQYLNWNFWMIHLAPLEISATESKC